MITSRRVYDAVTGRLKTAHTQKFLHHLYGTTYPQSDGSYRFAVTNEYAYGL